jgi:hypothetical protein
MPTHLLKGAELGLPAEISFQHEAQLESVVVLEFTQHPVPKMSSKSNLHFY